MEWGTWRHPQLLLFNSFPRLPDPRHQSMNGCASSDSHTSRFLLHPPISIKASARISPPPPAAQKKKKKSFESQAMQGTERGNSDSKAMGEDAKFFSRLLTREDLDSNNNSSGYSCRIYYTAFSGSVPFVWEAEPGKPKAPAAAGEAAPAPLNPPPFLRSAPRQKSSAPCPCSSAEPRPILQKVKSILQLGAKLKSAPRLHKAPRNPAQISQSCWRLAGPSAADYGRADCQISESGNSSDLSKSSSDSGSEFEERFESIGVSRCRNWPGSPLRSPAFLLYGGRRRRCQPGPAGIPAPLEN